MGRPARQRERLERWEELFAVRETVLAKLPPALALEVVLSCKRCSNVHYYRVEGPLARLCRQALRVPWRQMQYPPVSSR